MCVIESDILAAVEKPYRIASAMLVTAEGEEIITYLNTKRIDEVVFSVNGIERFLEDMPHKEHWVSAMSVFLSFSMFTIDYDDLTDHLNKVGEKIASNYALALNNSSEISIRGESAPPLDYNTAALFMFLLKRREETLHILSK